MARPLHDPALAFASLAFEMQQVIFLRMLRVAGGGALAQRELHRMVEEKMTAAAEAGMAIATGKADDVLGIYQRKVKANRRRLRRKA